MYWPSLSRRSGHLVFISVFEVTCPGRGCGTCGCDMHPMWDIFLEPAPNPPHRQCSNSWWWFRCQVMSDSCYCMDCSPPGSSVHGILQARILEWVELKEKLISSPLFTGEEILDPNEAMLRGKPSLMFPTGPLPDLLVHPVWLLKVIHKEALFCFQPSASEVPLWSYI